MQEHAWRDQVEYHGRSHRLQDLAQSIRVTHVSSVVVRRRDQIVVVWSVGADLDVVDVHVFGACYAAFRNNVVDDVVRNEATALENRQSS